MSAHIVMGEPLTEGQRRYLTERGQFNDIAIFDGAAERAEQERLAALAEESDEDDLDEDDETEDEVEDYMSFTKADLQAKLTERQLDTSGKVAELRERLMDDDRERAEAESDEDDAPGN